MTKFLDKNLEAKRSSGELCYAVQALILLDFLNSFPPCCDLSSADNLCKRLARQNVRPDLDPNYLTL